MASSKIRVIAATASGMWWRQAEKSGPRRGDAEVTGSFRVPVQADGEPKRVLKARTAWEAFKATRR